MENFEILQTSQDCSFYGIPNDGETKLKRYIASTEPTRMICNDPAVVGVEYTNGMQEGVAHVLRALERHTDFHCEETSSAVLHILRGGLNFGIREALAEAYGWNRHSSAFLSAQRARTTTDPDEWFIKETDYQKVYLPSDVTVFFGDVVATGTTLFYALRCFIELAKKAEQNVSQIVFFTIGGMASERVLTEVDTLCREAFPSYKGATIIYLEGRFGVADASSNLSVKITGTDLLRSDCLVAPEFKSSQYDNPTYPLERCTIYDAGSRAFWLPEYAEDVIDYWNQTLELARGGMSFESLLKQRLPELDASRFGEVDLVKICTEHLARLEDKFGS